MSEMLSAPRKEAFENWFRFPTGELRPEELEAVLDALPVDITFVKEDDTVCYLTTPKERIFMRTPAVLGRKVQNCHPKRASRSSGRKSGK